MNIPLTKPFFNENEVKAIRQVLKSGWVTQGPKVAEFERKIAKYCDAKYAVATTSATTGLFLSLYALGIGKGDEVIVPSFTFIATANVVMHVGAKPIFVDIDEKTYNIDPNKIENSITPRTRAIIPVDQVGLPCNLDKITKIAKKHNLLIIEDAACSLGSIYRGKKIGSFAGVEAVCFSFHPRKSITTGEGGMILTNNEKLAKRLGLLRHHGMAISDLERHNSKKITHESYSEIGFNFRMTDLQAAVGIEQLKKLPKFLKLRKEIASRYTQAFKKIDIIITPFIPKNVVPNWQSYVIRLKKNSKITRDRLMQKLLDNGIATRRGVMAVHLEPAYKNIYKKINLPITENSTSETISLPIYVNMKKNEQNYVIKKIINYAKE